MTDDTNAYRTLLRAISDLKEGTPVHADSLRVVFEAAQLTSSEKSGALRTACREGYIYAPHKHLPDGSVAFYAVPSRHGPRKGGDHRLYARTAKPVPEHVCQVTP